MTELTLEVEKLLTRELRAFAREMELFPDDDSLWRTLPGVTNSAGNLALHACGNLRHFVGTVLGDTGYERDREAEFSSRGATRAAVAKELEDTAGVLAEVLPRVSDEVLAAPFPQPVGGVSVRCDRFLLHLCTHLAFHLGQAGYLRRALSGDDRNSGAVSVAALAGD